MSNEYPLRILFHGEDVTERCTAICFDPNRNGEMWIELLELRDGKAIVGEDGNPVFTRYDWFSGERITQ